MNATERHSLIDARLAAIDEQREILDAFFGHFKMPPERQQLIADRIVESRAQYALDGPQQWAELRQADQHEGALYRLEAYASMRAPLKSQP